MQILSLLSFKLISCNYIKFSNEEPNDFILWHCINPNHTEISMKELKIAGNKVLIYDSIEEMPSDRYQEFNRLMLIDAGIGADAVAIGQHLNSIVMLAQKKDNESLKKELNNYNQALYFIMDGVSPKTLAFCALIKEFNGKPVELNDESVRKIHDRLMKEKKGVLDKLIKDQKKNLDVEIESFFPERSNNNEVLELYALKRKKIQETIRGLKSGNYEKADEIQKKIDDFRKFIDFSGSKGYEVYSKKTYEDIKLIIAREFGINTSEMTVLQFYQSADIISKERKQKEKQLKSSSNGRKSNQRK